MTSTRPHLDLLEAFQERVDNLPSFIDYFELSLEHLPPQRESVHPPKLLKWMEECFDRQMEELLSNQYGACLAENLQKGMEIKLGQKTLKVKRVQFNPQARNDLVVEVLLENGEYLGCRRNTVFDLKRTYIQKAQGELLR